MGGCWICWCSLRHQARYPTRFDNKAGLFYFPGFGSSVPWDACNGFLRDPVSLFVHILSIFLQLLPCLGDVRRCSGILLAQFVSRSNACSLFLHLQCFYSDRTGASLLATIMSEFSRQHETSIESYTITTCHHI